MSDLDRLLSLNLTDRYNRLVLADCLEELGRDSEAELLRDPTVWTDFYVHQGVVLGRQSVGDVIAFYDGGRDHAATVIRRSFYLSDEGGLVRTEHLYSHSVEQYFAKGDWKYQVGFSFSLHHRTYANGLQIVPVQLGTESIADCS